MKLSKCLTYINTALNYPALTYLDINLFFDIAISELNTTLHTSIPSVSFMTEEFRQRVSKVEVNKVILKTDPALTNYIIPTDPENPLENGIQAYYSGSTHKFYILDSYLQEYTEYDIIKAIFINTAGIHLYQAVNYGSEAAWAEVPMDNLYECDLDDYLPDDWVLLWLIPYVCYKYTVRDGGTAQTFAEELSQGFQQLQETYDVPDKVILATVADKKAYLELVEKALQNEAPNLNVLVPTRAIYESMKHSRAITIDGHTIFDRGGF